MVLPPKIKKSPPIALKNLFSSLKGHKIRETAQNSQKISKKIKKIEKNQKKCKQSFKIQKKCKKSFKIQKKMQKNSKVKKILKKYPKKFGFFSKNHQKIPKTHQNTNFPYETLTFPKNPKKSRT